MNLMVKKRLKFIEARLFWEGWIRRGNIEEFFQISTPQATKDIKKYKGLAPDNIIYDTNNKMYVAAENFKPIFEEPSSEDYLNRLLHLKRKTPQYEFFCGKIVSYMTIPRIGRFVDTNVLRNLIKALNNNLAIKICYQSMSKEMPTSRWISPHSLAHDGNRWHSRAFCHNKLFFSDFNLSRIIEVTEFKENSIKASLDYQWNTEVTLKIVPNPRLEGGKRACVELDYDMEGGVKEFKIPAAFYYYIKLNYGFDVNKDDEDGRRQQIVLNNKEEIEQKVEFLHEMSTSAIGKAIDEGSITVLK